MRKLRNLFLTVLLAAVFFCGLSFTAEAAQYSGYVNSIYWHVNTETGVLTLSGSGAMPNTGSSTPWLNYSSYITSVNIGSGITSISDAAFRGTRITGVTIPDSVGTIGSYAFQNCGRLSSVQLSANLTEIGAYAFEGCTALKAIELPDRVSSIREYAFHNSGLSSIQLNTGLSAIGQSAFSGTAITSISLPDNLSSIGAYAFYACFNLKSINIPRNVSSIGEKAYGTCSALTSITVDAANTVYDSRNGCNAIIKTSDNTLIQGCRNTVIPDTVKAIGAYAFSGQTQMASVIIPEGVESIGSYAFYCCHKLTEITIPSTVVNMGDNSFSNCSGLISVTVSEGVEKLGYGSFSTCKRLSNVKLPESLTDIGSCAFYDCDALSSISLPSGLKTIGSSAFADCGLLSEITLPGGMTVLGSYCFSGCTSLASIVIPSGISSLPDHIFNECTGLTSVQLSEGLTSIGAWAFYSCSSLSELSIPTTVKTIGEYAFRNCTSLPSANIPEGVTQISEYAFNGCKKLSQVSLPSGLTSIGEAAFADCSSLKSITLPDGLTKICDYAFKTTGLTAIEFPATVSSIGQECFESCTALERAVLSDKLTSLPYCLFYGCTSLKSVNIPASVKSIGDGAFYNTILSEVIYSNTQTRWNTISVSKTGNNPLINASIVFSSTDGGALTDNISWSFDTETGTLTISGFGAMPNNSRPWSYYLSATNNIVISDKITSLPSDAFSGSNIKGITLPSKLTKIPYGAFYCCSKLKSISIPEGVTAIEAYAFVNCGSLTEIRLPESLQSIDRDSFFGSDALSDIYYPGYEKQFKSISYWYTLNSPGTISALHCKQSALAITVQPKSLEAELGKNAVFTVTATGDEVTYQWYYKNPKGTEFKPISGATESVCTIEMTEARNGRQVYCVISDASGISLQSETVTMTIPTTPDSSELKITAQPQNVSCAVGQTAVFTVSASGNGLKYQWYYKNPGKASFSAHSGAATASYSIEMTEARDGRQMYCIITDAGGNTLRTDTVSMTIGSAPVSSELKITAQPQNVSCAVGQTAVFTVSATGNGLKYQWYYKNPGKASFSAHSGATTASCSIEMTEARDGRQMYCKITDAGGNTLRTDTVSMTIGSAPVSSELKITAQPQNVSCAVGQTAVFTVSASGNGLKYQWYYKNPGKASFSAHSGATTASYSIEMTDARDGRQMYCKITDASGNTLQTNTVTMTVGSAPASSALKITAQPQNVSCAVGQTAVFTVSASGNGLKYQWYYKNPGKASFSAHSGATSASYSIEMTDARDGRQMYCIITDASGNTLQTDTVTMSIPLLSFGITKQPASVTVANGKNAKFTVEAVGEGLTYQWYYKNPGSSVFKLFSGETEASCTIQMTEARDGRQMYCVVTDKYGNTETSSTAKMTLLTFGITKQPSSVKAASGTTVTFKVTAVGEGLKYQWYYMNPSGTEFKPVSGATSASYSLEMTSARNGRQMYCVITNSSGKKVTSNTVKMTMTS